MVRWTSSGRFFSAAGYSLARVTHCMAPLSIAVNSSTKVMIKTVYCILYTVSPYTATLPMPSATALSSWVFGYAENQKWSAGLIFRINIIDCTHDQPIHFCLGYESKFPTPKFPKFTVSHTRNITGLVMITNFLIITRKLTLCACDSSSLWPTHGAVKAA